MAHEKRPSDPVHEECRVLLVMLCLPVHGLANISHTNPIISIIIGP